MPVLLKTTETTLANRRLVLRLGQEARVGRSDSMELSVSEDALLAEEHFWVRCGEDAVIEAIDEQATLAINGEELRRFSLSGTTPSNATFVAGDTEFLVQWTPELSRSYPSDRLGGDETDEDTTSLIDASARIRQVAGVMKLSENAVALVDQADALRDYLDSLVHANLADDFVRFVAGLLPANLAVTWAMDVARDAAEDENTMASPAWSEAINQWTKSPQEAQRLEVKKQLDSGGRDSGGLGNIAKWITHAVVYSGGSLGTADQPHIAPPAHLSSVALLTAYRWFVANASDRAVAIGQWIKSGQQMVEANQAACLLGCPAKADELPSSIKEAA